MRRKGQLNAAALSGVIIVIVLILVIGILFTVSQKTYATLRDTANIDQQTQNENLSIASTFTNNTAIALLEQRLVGGSDVLWNGTRIINSDGGKNYTIVNGDQVTPASITITNSSKELAYYLNSSGRSLTFQGQYFIGSIDRNITLTAQGTTKTLSDFQVTWTVVIAAFVIITLVIGLATLFYNKMG